MADVVVFVGRGGLLAAEERSDLHGGVQEKDCAGAAVPELERRVIVAKEIIELMRRRLRVRDGLSKSGRRQLGERNHLGGRIQLSWIVG
jgi:hypothetical protein